MKSIIPTFSVLILVISPFFAGAQWNTTITSPVLWQANGTISNLNLISKFNLPPTDAGTANISSMTSNWDIGGGYGIIEGANVVSPIAWMYNYGGRNAFTIAAKNYTGGQGTSVLGDYLYPLLQVRESGQVGIGTVTPAPNSKLDIQGGGLNIGGSGNMDATLHIKASFGNWDRLTQIHPSVANKPALNLMASTDGNTNYNWWSWGVLSSGQWAMQPSTSFGGSTGLFVDRNGSVGIGNNSPEAKLDVNGNISVAHFGSVSSYRSPINTYTNLFLGGGIADQGNGTFKVIGDGGSNYFAGIKMDNSGGNVGTIKFYSGPSISGSNYVLNNNDLESYLRMVIVNGNVGIGNPNPDAKLAVKGQIHAQEVKVDLNGAVAPDYVFEKDYKLTPLEEIKNYIDQNKHLPEVPSAKEMEKNGVQLGEMNMLLLKKIEEITLHMIEQQDEIKELKAEVKNLKSK